MTAHATNLRRLPRATRPAAPVPPAAPAVPDIDRLDALLVALIDEHKSLLSLTHEHRDAVAQADARKLKGVIEQTGAVIQRVAQVETERQRLVARPDGRPSTIDELLAVVDSADRDRLSGRAAALRALIQQVREEQEAVRLASEALATHMRGLIQQVASKLSHAGTYGRAGRVETRAQVMSGVDVGA
jgi:hypothetical protein